jgi:hypothetical protein
MFAEAITGGPMASCGAADELFFYPYNVRHPSAPIFFLEAKKAQWWTRNTDLLIHSRVRDGGIFAIP